LRKRSSRVGAALYSEGWRFFRGLLGLAEMKMVSKRGSTAATEVLQAPRESFVPETSWRGRGPAPAGSLHRAYAGNYPDDLDDAPTAGERPYVPRRGSMRGRFDALRRSLPGRILLGVSVLLVFTAAAVGLAAARYFVLHDPRFVLSTTDDIAVEGNAHLTRDQVLSVFGGDLERNIFRMSLAERRADLERLPWVQHATVMRLLPDHIRVEIRERVPVAFVRQGTQIGLVDAGGVLLDMPAEDAGDPRYSFPVLTGINAEDPQSTRAARVDIYRQFMKALDGSPNGGGEKLSNSISEVDVSNPEDVKALVTDGGSDILVHFGDSDFLTRYNEFEQHLPQWKQQYPKLASADMRYEGQIVLEMQPGTAAPTSDSSSTVADAPSVKPVSKPAAKPVAKPVAKPLIKPALKPVKAAAKPDANAKMFASLAAARKASQSRTGATP
jgi:cell division protein FtsQ